MDKPIFDHTAHKAIWDYLVKHPDKTKLHAVLELGYDVGKFAYSCPACEATNGYDDVEGSLDGKRFCKEYCPLKWGTVSCVSSDEALYNQYLDARYYDHVSRIAAKIRDLPLNDRAMELYEII